MLTSFGTETLAAMRVAWTEYNTAFAQLIGDWRG
jgi:hypothetical protein